MAVPFDGFYEGRRVLITGDSGFKGSWLSRWLTLLGADVHGIGLATETSPALFDVLELHSEIAHTELDIRDEAALRRFIGALRPDVIIHMAAQALVRRSYAAPLITLDTNVMGTANLLDAVRTTGYTREEPCAVVVITSDKCYENPETGVPCRESDPMGGHDPYSASKGAAELITAAWSRSFFDASDAVRVASCRAGNVIGGGDWSRDRIVPDTIAALQAGSAVQVRSPHAIRPWQHVLEPLSGYLQVGAGLHTSAARCAGAWNFGPGAESERPVGELCDAVVRLWGEGSWDHAAEEGAVHEAHYLRLAIDRALTELGWRPVWSFEESIAATVEWYRQVADADLDRDVARALTDAQITSYVDAAADRHVRWLKGTS